MHKPLRFFGELCASALNLPCFTLKNELTL